MYACELREQSSQKHGLAQELRLLAERIQASYVFRCVAVLRFTPSHFAVVDDTIPGRAHHIRYAFPRIFGFGS